MQATKKKKSAAGGCDSEDRGFHHIYEAVVGEVW